MTTFTYNTEDANPLVEPGTYEAVIFNASKEQTKKGDDMLVITTKVYNPNGPQPLVYDHITAPFGIRRLKSLCHATGADFSGGKVDPEYFKGKNVKVKLKIQHDDTGDWEDKNAVVEYLPDQSGDVEGPGFTKCVEAVRKTYPTIEDAIVKTELDRISNEIIGKPMNEITQEEWARLASEAPAQVIPI